MTKNIRLLLRRIDLQEGSETLERCVSKRTARCLKLQYVLCFYSTSDRLFAEDMPTQLNDQTLGIVTGEAVISLNTYLMLVVPLNLVKLPTDAIRNHNR